MHHEMPSCPIQGEHTGVIPDAPELCARLVSDCTYPEKMLYTVYSCANESQVYEGIISIYVKSVHLFPQLWSF